MRTPGRFRFHLPVGQPLASDCRLIANGAPFLNIMRFGRFVGAKGHRGVRRTGRASGRPAVLYIFACHAMGQADRAEQCAGGPASAGGSVRVEHREASGSRLRASGQVIQQRA